MSHTYADTHTHTNTHTCIPARTHAHTHTHKSIDRVGGKETEMVRPPALQIFPNQNSNNSVSGTSSLDNHTVTMGTRQHNPKMINLLAIKVNAK